MATAVSVITLGVSDLQRARHYYAALFGDDDDANTPGPCYFRLPGSWLALYPREQLAGYFGVDPEGTGFNAVTLSINVADAAQVDILCNRLRELGGRVTVPPGAASWGGHVACIADLDGHLLELVWNPKSRIPVQPQ